MAIRRRSIYRILGIAFVSSTLASTVAYLLLLNNAMTVSASVLTAFLRDRISLSKAQCEASPAVFVIDGTEGLSVFAYSLETGRSLNNQAPPLDPVLWKRVRDGEELATRLLWFERDGGAVVLRTGGDGPCNLFQARYSYLRWRRAQILSAIGASHLLVLGLASTLTFAFGVSPLLRRIHLLAQSARHVGDPQHFVVETQPIQDELGMIVTSLRSAHLRIVEGEAELRRKQQVLLAHLADVSHDVLAPLASLQLLFDELRATAAQRGAHEQESLKDAAEEIEYLGALIANLSIEVQLQEGLDPFSVQEITDIGLCVNKSCTRMRVLARARAMSLEGSWPDEPLLVRCSALILERVLCNLLMNAISHGEVDGHIAVLASELPEAGFELVVMDDGPGVLPSDLLRLTERRFRGSTARAPTGSGLGLSIVGEVCRRAGWTLEFLANTPRGLRVRIVGKIEVKERQIHL